VLDYHIQLDAPLSAQHKAGVLGIQFGEGRQFGGGGGEWRRFGWFCEIRKQVSSGPV